MFGNKWPRLSTMVMAFAGWPDATESATGAVRYLADQLDGTKIAEIDPEEFYVFTENRPQIRKNQVGVSEMVWPVNQFYQVNSDDHDHGLLLFVGTEPNLRWRTFSNILFYVARKSQVETVFSLGALLDEVPHTRATRVTGRASVEDLKHKMEWIGVSDSSYEGPVSIHSTVIEDCERDGLTYASLWGHSPHYINYSANPKVTYALLDKLRLLLGIDLDLESLKSEGYKFETEIAKALVTQSDAEDYVRQLELEYDTINAPPNETLDPKGLLSDLEDFLRRQQK